MKPINIDNFTDEELKAELARRQKVRSENERLERQKKIREIIKHRDVLAQLMKHSSASCADIPKSNAYYNTKTDAAECNLCCLMDLYDGQDDVNIDFDIRLTEVKEM
jgi:hypothetical protein